MRTFGKMLKIEGKLSIRDMNMMIFAIVISEYRERKILKRFQVTPISPGMILCVHLCIYTLYAFASVVTLWIVVKLFWNFTMHGSPILFFIGWLFVLLSIFSIGMLVGGIAKNSKTASVIASVLYFPMLVFSGATLPYEVMPDTMQKVVAIFPMTQGIKILKAEILGQPVYNITMSVILLAVMAVICIGISIKCFQWE